jgi:hypothetical protein
LNHTNISDAAFLVFIFSIIQVVSMFTYKHVEMRFQSRPKPVSQPEAQLATAA